MSMCSLFGLIDFKGVLNTHTKNKISEYAGS